MMSSRGEVSDDDGIRGKITIALSLSSVAIAAMMANQNHHRGEALFARRENCAVKKLRVTLRLTPGGRA